MIKVANNIKRMLRFKASSESPQFVNHSTDPLHPALAPVGMFPQSYYIRGMDDETRWAAGIGPTVFKAPQRRLDPWKDSRGPTNDWSPISSEFTPEQYAMAVNTMVGMGNSDLRADGSYDDSKRHRLAFPNGADGPSISFDLNDKKSPLHIDPRGLKDFYHGQSRQLLPGMRWRSR